MQTIQLDYESRLEQSNGAYYALKLAHVHLESRLKTDEQVRENQEKVIKDQKTIIVSLVLGSGFSSSNRWFTV